MYPNYPVIADIENNFLRQALYTAEGEELARLQRASPECFSEEPTNLHVPVSLIRRKAEDNSLNEGNSPEEAARDGTYRWSEALNQLGVPLAFAWYDDFPPEVADQLRGQVVAGGIHVVYMGRIYMLADLGSSIPDADVYDGRITLNVEDGGYLHLVDPRFIDLKR